MCLLVLTLSFSILLRFSLLNGGLSEPETFLYVRFMVTTQRTLVQRLKGQQMIWLLRARQKSWGHDAKPYLLKLRPAFSFFLSGLL